jgi:hypothetical protein
MCIRDSYVYQEGALCFFLMKVMLGRLEDIVLSVIMLQFQYSFIIIIIIIIIIIEYLCAGYLQLYAKNKQCF